MQQYILAIDQGTTGTTALIIDVSTTKLRVIGRDTVDFGLNFPHSGWVEQDLNDIWRSLESAVKGAVRQAKNVGGINFRPEDIIAIGITNQRETLAFFDRKTSLPLRSAIVWQCKRSNDICVQMKNEGLEAEIRDKTGLCLDPYFSGSKLAWVIANDRETATKLKNGDGLFGTIDTFLLHKMTNGASYATEPSNASRTLLFNIHKKNWDEKLKQLFQIPQTINFPEVKDSDAVFGKTSGLSFLPDGIPITGILGDQQAALAGQGGFYKGLGKCTYGTGAFLLMNIGESPILSRNGLLTTIAWTSQGQTSYALEGSAFIAGAAVQFLRDQWELIQSAKEMSDIAQDVVAAPQLYFVPSLSGLGAPYWNPLAEGAIFGLTRGTTKAQIMLATLEGISFQVFDLVTSMIQDVGHGISELRVDGGACVNDRLLQIQANILGITVNRPTLVETTALGAAYFAGLGVKRFSGFSELENLRVTEAIFKPDETHEGKKFQMKILSGWKKAIDAVQLFHGATNI